MKDIRFKISLYLIIPLIFSGFSTLSLVVAFRLTEYHMSRNLDLYWPLTFWGIMLAIFTFACGLLIVKFLIDPVKRFVTKTQTMGVVRDIPAPPVTSTTDDDIHKYSLAFDQISELLSRVEARQLFPDIIGQSRSMRSVFNKIIRVAQTNSTVLISGETGTGKELVAQSIHLHSGRQTKPFIAINCAAIPEGLLESALFGHEKGAFTGAVQRRPGKFELAHEGTLFLDEIGDMPLEIQAKVLRALEEQRIERLGSSSSIKIDVRFIAATNKKLVQMTQSGHFRQDLFFRLNVFVIHLPPLRERREDIPLLVDHFLQTQQAPKKLSTFSIQMLMAYDWPGNVRELQNAIKSAIVMAGKTIEPMHLPISITQNFPHTQTHIPLNPERPENIDKRLHDMEKAIIIQALTQARGIQKQAATLLGIKERSLWHRLKKYNIDAATFKIK